MRGPLPTTLQPLSLVCLGLVAFGVSTSLAPAAERPNIVIVLADDMGYSDLGCYGGEIETPYIDGLAAGGVRFTQFYNTARCCPTRAALLTGLYQHQAGIGHMVGNLGRPSYQGYLNQSCVTIAEALKPAGYRTLSTGKWHVGSQRGQWPLDRGFDRYYGTPSGGGMYFKGSVEYRKRDFTLGNEVVEFPDDGYTTDLFTDHAIDFVYEAVQDEKPFFLYLAHIAPHWPLQAKPADIEKYAGRYDRGWGEVRRERFRKQRELGLVDERWSLSPAHPQVKPWKSLSAEKRADLSHRMAVYAAQIDCIDQNMGRLLACLKRNGVFENTVVMVLSDNGCSAEGGPGGFRKGDTSQPIGTGTTYASAGLEWANVSDTPFRKFKMNTHEGGISTPLVVHWPAGLKRRGELERQPGHVIDLMPTCVELAGAEYPTERKGHAIQPTEGRSLVPAMQGDTIERDGLYWEHEGNRAVRKGDWKLVAEKGEPWQLFNLAADRTENDDLAAKHPERVADLKADWESWAKRCGVAKWPVRRK